jgi:hypothetical protein
VILLVLRLLGLSRRLAALSPSPVWKQDHIP